MIYLVNLWGMGSLNSICKGVTLFMDKKRIFGLVVCSILIFIFLVTAIISRNFMITGFVIGIASLITLVIILVLKKRGYLQN